MKKKDVFKAIKNHIGKEPKIINLAFNLTDRHIFTGKHIHIDVVQNYIPIGNDKIVRTCLNCAINGQCTPYAMSHEHMCYRFNYPAILKVTVINKIDCQGCKHNKKKTTQSIERLNCISCNPFDPYGMPRPEHTKNLSFYAQESAELNRVFSSTGYDRGFDPFENPEVCKECKQLDLEKMHKKILTAKNEANREFAEMIKLSQLK